MSDAAVSEREQKVLRIIETARAKRPRFKDETVTMAHGAGGKATQTLIEGLLVPALAKEGETLEDMGDAGVVRSTTSASRSPPTATWCGRFDFPAGRSESSP